MPYLSYAIPLSTYRLTWLADPALVTSVLTNRMQYGNRRSPRSRPSGQVLMPVYAEPMEGFRKPLVILPIAHLDVSVMCFTYIFSLTFIFIAESFRSFNPLRLRILSHSFTRYCFLLSSLLWKQFPFEIG